MQIMFFGWIMKILYYMDPVLDMDHEFDNRGFVAEMDLNAQFLGRYNKTQREHEIHFLALDRILKFHNLKNQLKNDCVDVIEIKESEVEGILKFNRISAVALANSLCDRQAKDQFKRFIKSKINFIPDVVIYWEECNVAIKELFPNATFLQGSHTGFSSLERSPDVLYTVHDSKNLNNALFDAISAIKIGTTLRSEVETFKSKFRKDIYVENQVSRKWLDPDNRFKKIIFYPGNFESFRFKRYSNVNSNEAVVAEILKVIPKDFGLVFTRHPLDKTSSGSSILKDERVIDLSDLALADKEISLRVMPYVDAVVNVYSNIYILAYLYDKPVYSFGESPNSKFAYLNYTKMMEPIDEESSSYLTYQANTYKTLYYNITRKVPVHFLRNSRNAQLYLNNILAKKTLPILNTVSGYFQQIYQTRLVSESPLHNYSTNIYDELLGSLLDNKIKNIGFDVFDTLVVRPFVKPTDLFQFVEQRAEQILGDISHNFASARQMAERIARDGKIEVTLDDIYDTYSTLTDIDQQKIEALKSLELESEYKFCYARESVKNIFNLAKIHGKNIFIASDMYLSYENIAQILKKSGYDMAAVKLYVSSSSQCVKHNGSLFNKIIHDLGFVPSETLFVGDNIRSDVNIPMSSGMKAIHYPKPIDRYNQLVGYLPQNLGTLLKSGLIPHHAVVANKVFDNPFIKFDNGTLVNNSSALLGYSIFGPLVLSIISWLITNIENKNYKEIVFCSRDSKLIDELYSDIKQRFYADRLPDNKYIFISRTSTLPAYCDRSHLLNILGVYNTKHDVKTFLSKVLKIDIDDEKIKSIIKQLKIDLNGSVEHNATVIIKLLDGINNELFPGQRDSIIKYFESVIVSDRVAMFDLGTRGTSRDVISNLLHKKIDLFLFRETFYKPYNNIVCYMRDSLNPFRHGLRTVLPQFYEQIISDPNTCTCAGYEQVENRIVPIVDVNDLTKSTQLVNETQHYIKQFCHHFVNLFGTDFHVINCQSRDVMIFPVSYLCSGSSDVRLLSQFVGDDPFWSNNQFAIIPTQKTKASITVRKIDSPIKTSVPGKDRLLDKLRTTPDLYIRDSRDAMICKMKPYLKIPVLGNLIKRILVREIEKKILNH